MTAGEIGQNTCAHDYIDQVMAWADAHGVGYLAWTWNPWGCSQGNVLINDYSRHPDQHLRRGLQGTPAHPEPVNTRPGPCGRTP